MRHSTFILLFLCSAFTAFTQRINGFNLYPLSNGVNVNFNIAPGPDCYGYKIYHCLDSVSYIEIFDFAGICGTSLDNEFKSFTHTNATLNQINYYKVQLYPYEVAYNRIFYSSDGKKNISAFPNPASSFYGYISMKVAGVNNVSLEGYVCNEYGNKIQTLNLQTIGDVFQIQIETYPDGVYFVWVSDGANIYSTKFIVFNTN